MTGYSVAADLHKSKVPLQAHEEVYQSYQHQRGTTAHSAVAAVHAAAVGAVSLSPGRSIRYFFLKTEKTTTFRMTLLILYNKSSE